MFVIVDLDRQHKSGESGSVLLLVMIIIAVSVAFMTYQAARFENVIKVQASSEVQKTRHSWGLAIADRVDCLRTMGSYTSSNRCPAGTARTLTYTNAAPMVPAGPNIGFSLGKNWYAKVTCGTNDLNVLVTRIVNGSFENDPLTGIRLNFTHPASQISDGGENIPICPSYFGGTNPAAFGITMTIATQQKIAASYAGPNATVDWVGQSCDASLGIIAELDHAPFPSYWSEGGASGDHNSRTAMGTWMYNFYRGYFNFYGITGPLLSSWTVVPTQIRELATNYCDRICTINYGASAGVSTKCDPAVSAAWPALGQVVRDQSSSQANCLCLK